MDQGLRDMADHRKVVDFLEKLVVVFGRIYCHQEVLDQI